MNKQLSSPLSQAIRKVLKPTISTVAVSTVLLASSSAWAVHGTQETAFIFFNDNLLLAPTTTAPAVPAVSVGDQPLMTSSCVDLGYVLPGSTIAKKFTIVSSESGGTSGTPGDFLYDSLSSITFTGGTELQQLGSAQNATNLTNGIVVAPLCNSLGATTGGTTADPLKTSVCGGITSVVTTAPSGAVGLFDIQFTAPSTPQIIKGRYMNVYTSTDPVVNPLSVQVTASIVSSLTPKIQVLDSSLATAPAGVDVPNGGLTPINFTPAPLTSTSPPVTKVFSVKNLGATNLLVTPTTATCISSSGTTVAEFTVTPFLDDGIIDRPAHTTDTNTTIAPVYSPGCPTAVTDYTKFNVTFTAPTVATQTKYTCNVNFTSNDGGITGTKFTFPVEATVNPPPPLKPEIDVYDGTKLIPNLDKTGVDFGTTTVGKPVQRTITVKNPSGTNLNVFDFSSNLPNGFSLLNANYASTIPPGGSSNLIFQCDATVGGSFGAAQDSCASNPLGAGCALRIPSNDDDNPLWEFNGGGVENPYTFPLKCVVTGGASSNISLNLTQPANGVVTSDSGGISCGTGSTTCSASYAPGATVKLTAAADANATFSGWGGDCSGTTSPLTVTMDAAKDCTATFTSGGGVDPGTQIALTISTPSNGVITSDKGGINCGTGGSTCNSSYDPSTVVVLTATPDNGATFTSWGGSCSGTTSPLSVTMDTAKNCTATFETTVVTTDVTLTITKPEIGNIMSSAGGINCGTAGATCSATYSKDATIQLMGAADNMTLDTWTGDCSGSNNPLSVAMSQDKTCSATFKAGSGGTTQPTLTITQPTGGSVSGNPGGISCGASGSTCVASYTAGDVISLTAIPALGNTFTGWGGSCVGTTNPLSITMDAAKTCTAAFTTAGGNDPPPVTNQLLTINTPTGGKVTSDVGGISCGTNSLNCTANYTTGSIVRLTAIADTGATFASWGGNCTGTTSPTVLTMDAAKTCSATFTNTGGNTCSSTNLPACTTETDCNNAGGTFAGGVCTTGSTGSNCSATQLSACTTEVSCGGAGGIFVSNACTVAPILSHPQKGVAALINKATEQTFNVPAFFAAGASVNGTPFAPMVSVKASDVVDWAVNITVNPIHLGQSANVLFVIGVEPPSPTDPITGYSGNEDTQYFALDEGLNLFPVNLYAGPAEWGAEVDKMVLKPFKRVTLQSRMSLSLRKGTLAALVNGQSRARVYTFVGYALADGTIVYNGMPIITTLE